jgi:hypothetical protein
LLPTAGTTSDAEEKSGGKTEHAGRKNNGLTGDRLLDDFSEI